MTEGPDRVLRKARVAKRKAAIDEWTWKGLLPHRIVPTAQGRLNLSAMAADRLP